MASSFTRQCLTKCKKIFYYGCESKNIWIQGSLAIYGGFVPEKSQTINTETAILDSNETILAKNSSFPSLLVVFASANYQDPEYLNRE